jgi:hypothetical protein
MIILKNMRLIQRATFALFSTSKKMQDLRPMKPTKVNKNSVIGTEESRKTSDHKLSKKKGGEHAGG